MIKNGRMKCKDVIKKTITKSWSTVKTRMALKYRIRLIWPKMMLRARMKKVVFGLNTNQKRKEKIIVSLTSIPSRLKNLNLVICSILVQTRKADQIILYLDDDVAMEQLPKTLLSLKQYGLRIENRPGNIKPHKKYYYAMKENPNDLVITIDDDMIYPYNLIEELYKTHVLFPDCVVAARGHRILFNKRGSMKSYNDWESEYECPNKPSKQLVATGVGGVLYPPHCMAADLLDAELLQRLSLNADDIWLKSMQVMKQTEVVLCDSSIRCHTAGIPYTKEISLSNLNVQKRMNDIYLENIMRYYHLDAKEFR